MTIRYEDIQTTVNGTTSTSLNKLTGKQIADIQGFFVQDDGLMVFVASAIVFTDGSTAWIETLDDDACIPGDNLPNMDQRTMGKLYKQQESS